MSSFPIFNVKLLYLSLQSIFAIGIVGFVIDIASGEDNFHNVFFVGFSVSIKKLSVILNKSNDVIAHDRAFSYHQYA